MKARYIISTGVLMLWSGWVNADGTYEEGFIPPPRDPKLPPAPPRTASSSETFIPGGCTTPMSRTESKKPPKPPTLITKLKD